MMTDTKRPEALPKFRAIDFINTEEELEVYVASRMLELQQGYDAARLEIEALRMRSAEPAGEYPPLPEPEVHDAAGYRRAFTADQMRAYVDADRAMRAQADSQPALPKITAEDRSFLHYNPNTDDIVEWVQHYASAAITADRAMRAQAAPAAVAGPVVGNPVEALDKIYTVYQRSMGKTEPDAEMAVVVDMTKNMLLSWWGEHREEIRAAMVAAFNAKAVPAAVAVPSDREAHISELLELLENGKGYPGEYFNHAGQYECYDCGGAHENNAEIEHEPGCSHHVAIANAVRKGELLALIRAAAPTTQAAPQQEPVVQGNALPREDFAWMVVQEACETEPADEDDPECIRILRIDLKSAVLAAFLRLDAARAQAKEGGE